MKKFVALCYIILLVIVAGCGGGVKEPQKQGTGRMPLVIGLMPDTDSAPFIVAREKGFFEAEGIEVTLRHFKSAMDRDAAMQSGNLDGAVSDLLAAAFLKAGGFDVKVTSMTNGSYRLVAGKGRSFDGVRSLRGKEVAVSSNTIIEYVTDRILEHNDMTSDAIRKVAIPQIPARLEMLQHGKLDAATLPEPMASVAVAGGCTYLTGSDELGINPGIMLFSAKSAAEKKEQIGAMYRAYNKAVEYLANTPRASYIDMLAEKSGFPAAAKEALKLPMYHKAARPKEKDVAEVMEWLRTKGLIKENYSYDDLVAGDVLP